MKINIFYDIPERGMDILTLKNNALDEVKTFLKESKIKFDTIVYGWNIWGWSKEFDFHVFENKPDKSRLNTIRNLFPNEKNGGKVYVIER